MVPAVTVWLVGVSDTANVPTVSVALPECVKVPSLPVTVTVLGPDNVPVAMVSVEVAEPFAGTSTDVGDKVPILLAKLTVLLYPLSDETVTV